MLLHFYTAKSNFWEEGGKKRMTSKRFVVTMSQFIGKIMSQTDHVKWLKQGYQSEI